MLWSNLVTIIGLKLKVNRCGSRRRMFIGAILTSRQLCSQDCLLQTKQNKTKKIVIGRPLSPPSPVEKKTKSNQTNKNKKKPKVS